MESRFTSKERKDAEEKIAKLEASGFFLLCGCSMGQPDASNVPEEKEEQVLATTEEQEGLCGKG